MLPDNLRFLLEVGAGAISIYVGWQIQKLRTEIVERESNLRRWVWENFATKHQGHRSKNEETDS